MVKIIIFFLFTILNIKVTFSQINLEWLKSYGGDFFTAGSHIEKTSDDNLIVVAHIYSANSSQDFWLLKIDNNGDTLWTKKFGGKYSDYPGSVKQTKDGGYIICGTSYSFRNGTNADIWIIKTDKLGNLEWDRYFGNNTSNDIGIDVIQSRDSGYAIVGYSSSSDLTSGWLIKTDKDGIYQWDNTFFAFGHGSFNEIQQTSDNGYIIIGKKIPNNKIWLLKTNQFGNFEWQKEFDTSNNFDVSFGQSVLQTEENGFIFIGDGISSNTGDEITRIVKIDSSRNLIWDKYFDGVGRQILKTSYNDFVIIGDLKVSDEDGELILTKINRNGEIISDSSFGGSQLDYSSSIVETIDKGYLIIGQSNSYNGPNFNLFLQKVSFIIIEKPSDTLIANGSYNIHWDYGGTTNFVRLEYSTNNGNNWITIENSIMNTGNYNWKVPNTPSTNCLLRIQDIDGYPRCTSTKFNIIQAPIIQTTNKLMFGNVTIDSTKIDSILIINTGSNILDINKIRAYDPSFKIQDSSNLFINPNNNHYAKISFSPLLQKSYYDSLQVYSNASNGTIVTYLSGTGIEKSLAILNISNSSIDFKQVGVNDSSSISFFIRNSGKENLKISDLQNKKDVFTTDSTNFIIPPDDSQQVSIKFTPVDNIEYYDTLYIYSNSPSSPDTIYLTGKGVLSPSSAQISLSSTSIQFGDVKVNSSKPKILKIFNFGSANLIVNRISFDGSEFSTQKQFPDTINQKDSSEIIIRFKPDSAVKFSRNLSIHNSTQDSLKIVSLSGNGFNYLSTISLNTSFTFGDVKNTNSYRIISLPGKNNNIKVQFSGEHKFDWKVFTDDGSDGQNYLVESSDFVFSPGTAFWALSSQQMPINQSDSSVQININDNSYPISLHKGWNLISTPFKISTSWSDVKSLNSLSATSRLWKWSGSWDSTTAVMEPYSGYYFNNITNLSSLKIPYNPNGSVNKTVLKKDSSSSSNNYLKVTVSRESKESENIYDALIKIDPSSKEGVDELDEYSPPSDFQNIGINLLRDNSGKRSDYLFADSRPAIGEGQEYNLQIKSIPNEAIILNTEGIENFSRYNLYLLDTRLNNVYNLKQRKSITLALGHVYNYFKLYIGTDDYVKTIKELAVPGEYKLYQNYPNPFNPSTVIRFSVPEAAEVTINIFNILGEKLSTLLNHQHYETGNYEIEFNGKELASAVYIVSMETSKYRMQKKMMLIK